MIKYRVLFFVLAFTSIAFAQGFNPGGTTQDPVTWKARAEKLDDNQYNLILEANIEAEWHIYSQFTDPAGPLPLELEFLKADEDYTLNGPTRESETHIEYSDIFEVDETFFSDTAKLTQEITLNNQTTDLIKLILKYQVCKEVCINEEKYVVFNLETGDGELIADYNAFDSYGNEVVEPKTEELEPVEKVVKQEEQKDLWTLFFVAFLSGFVALLTPCVFPMIPPRSALRSTAFAQELGNIISKAPKNEIANTTNKAKKIRLNQTFVESALSASAPKIAVTIVPRST